MGLRNIEILLKAFTTQYSFYVLGAGASAGIVPMTHELKDSTIQRWVDFGSYPIEPGRPDNVHKRIIGNYNISPDLLDNAIIKRLPNPALHAILYQALVPRSVKECPFQYQVFNSVNKPSIIFNMNVDGLAKYCCPGHIVLEPHGRIPPDIVHSTYWNHLIDCYMEFGDDFLIDESIGFPRVLLPQPEPRNITKQKNYDEVYKWFPFVQWVIIIGYSFGTFSDTIDDYCTFEFFRELLIKHPKPVIVIDPYPDRIVSLIQEAIKQREVFSIPACWDCLSQSIIEATSPYICSAISKHSSLIPEIIYRHDELCG